MLFHDTPPGQWVTYDSPLQHNSTIVMETVIYFVTLSRYLFYLTQGFLED